jgi:hypothetical protein
MFKKIALLPVPDGMRVKIMHIADKVELRDLARTYLDPAPRYATIAELRWKDTDELVAYATSYCSPRDVPSRKMGRAIAHNRVVGRYLKEQANVE